MSSILQRIREANKIRVETSENDVKTVVADQYIAEIKEKEREKVREEARKEFSDEAHQALLEAANTKLQAMEIERNSLNELLSQARSEAAQSKDLVNALKAEVKMLSITSEESKEEYHEAIELLNTRVQELELALVAERSKPVPAPVIQQEPLPSFEFTPVRGPDGRLEGVTAKPI